MIRGMVSTSAHDAGHLLLLGALVTHRRHALNLGKDEAAKECDMAPMTYRAVEEGRTVSHRTYAKIEKRYGFINGQCRAVLAGADSILLTDGTELIEGGLINRRPFAEMADDVKQAVTTAASLTAPDLTLAQAREMSEAVVKELQRRGILPSAS